METPLPEGSEGDSGLSKTQRFRKVQPYLLSAICNSRKGDTTLKKIFYLRLLKTHQGISNGAFGYLKNQLPKIRSFSEPPGSRQDFACFKTIVLGFPGGAVVKNPPANAGDTGSSPGLGRSHMQNN